MKNDIDITFITKKYKGILTTFNISLRKKIKKDYQQISYVNSPNR